MNNIIKIKSALNEIDNSLFLRPGIYQRLTHSLKVAIDALENIEGRYEHPNDLHNINSARLRGCQLEAKGALKQISEILEVK